MATIDTLLSAAASHASENGYTPGASPVLEALAAKVDEIEAAKSRAGTTQGILGVVSAFDVAVRAITGAVKPADFARHAVTHRCGSDNLPTTPLPAKYSSRDAGVVPSVRDQKQCGECWCFGAVGASEISAATLGKLSGNNIDWAEQGVIDCGQTGGCNGDWHTTALDILQAKGTVDEIADPYRADSGNGQCPVSATRRYVASYGYVGDNPDSIPSTDAIKAAILKYGAVVTTVFVDNAFAAYRSGVFRSNIRYGNGVVNHCVILTGWDDATQSWELRNSWSTTWGEQGYMRIGYGVNNIGYGTCWVAAKVDQPAPPKPDPTPDPKPQPIPPAPPVVVSYTLTGKLGDGGVITGNLTPANVTVGGWFGDSLDWIENQLINAAAKAKELVAAYGTDAADVYAALVNALKNRGATDVLDLYTAIRKLADDLVSRNTTTATPCGCKQVGITPADITPWIELAAQIAEMLRQWRQRRQQPVK